MTYDEVVVTCLFKELLLNPKVVGAAHSAAVGAGDTLEKIAETPKIICSRD